MIMPRKPSQATRIKQLEKELNLANGSLLNKTTHIDHLEKQLASMKESVEDLQHRIHIREEDIRGRRDEVFRREIWELNNHLEKERITRKGIEQDALATISQERKENFAAQTLLAETTKRLVREQNRNIALRAALKEVL